MGAAGSAERGSQPQVRRYKADAFPTAADAFAIDSNEY